MKHTKIIFFIALVFASFSLMGQRTTSTDNLKASTSVTIGDGSRNLSAILDIFSTTSGVRFPRMTEAQRDNLATVEGLMIYNTDEQAYQYNNGTSWVDFGSGATAVSDYIKVDSTNDIAGSTAALGSVIYNYETNATYKVQANPVTGYATDSIAVAPVSGGYAVLQSQNKVFKMSSFGISNDNTGLVNYTRFQNAIDFCANARLISDVDTFEVDHSGGAILIAESIEIDFQDNTIVISEANAEDWTYDFFSIVPSEAGTTNVIIKNVNIDGSTGRGFNLDGTKDTGTLNEKCLLDTGGSSEKTLNVTLENFSLVSGFVPYGVQFNGSPGALKWTGGQINVSSTDGVGVFGVGMTAIIKDVTFNKCGYEASEILGSQTYGVGMYFHPYVTYQVEGCKFYDQPRAFQCSSGTAYYETSWDYDVTPTDFQIIKKCYFDSTITEKAVVNSWYYPFGVIEDCIFNNSGNAIALVNSLKVERCFFSDNNAVSIISSYPPQNRDEIHNYNFTDCEFKGTGVATLTDDSGTSPIRGNYNFNNCKFFSTSGGFNLTGLDFAQDSARININIDRSYITNISNTSFFNFPSMADISIKNSILEGKTGRMFVIYPTASTEDYNGKFEIDNCRFINKNTGNPLWFYSGSSSYVGELRDQNLIIKNSRFPDGQIYMGYSYNATQKFFGVPLQEGLNFDTIATNYIPLNWNYNTYIVNGGTITDAYLQSSSNTGGGGIQDPLRLIKGSFWAIGGEDGATIAGTGNIKTINGGSLTIAANEKVEFRFDRITHNWEEVGEVDNSAFSEMYIADGTTATVAITSGTPAEITNWTGGELQNFSYSSGRLTYTNTETKTFLINTSISFSFSSSGKIVESWIYKNGAVVAKSEMHRKIGTGGDVGNGGKTCLIELAQNDYLEVFFDADGNGTVTIETANVNITQID